MFILPSFLNKKRGGTALLPSASKHPIYLLCRFLHPISFRDVINEYYAKDISKKTKPTFKAKDESGKHVASIPHYGYLKDSGKQKEYEERMKAKKKAQMDEQKEQIRAEDRKTGSYVKMDFEEKAMTLRVVVFFHAAINV